MRFRTSRCEAILSVRQSGPDGSRLDTLLHWMTLFIKVVTEVIGILADRLLERLDGLIRPVAAGDLAQQLAVTGLDRVRQALEELLDLVDVDAIEEAVGRRVDLHDLNLNRQRMALVLVEGLDQTLTAGQGALRVGVEL